MPKSVATRSESKVKKLKLDRVLDMDDRISNLPDSLIYHILSLLPTKQAVATSILSRTWKPFWTQLPTLDLKDQPTNPPNTFTYSMHRILALHRAPVLRNFRLKWYTPCDSFDLDTWIHIAIERNVQQLKLEIYLNAEYEDDEDGSVSVDFNFGDDVNVIYYGELFFLPRRLYSSKTLVVMELTGGILLNPIYSCEFPSLKILCLHRIYYEYDDSLSRFLSCCPILEDLSILRNGTGGLTELKISLAKLKRLYIEFKPFRLEPSPGYKLEINTPALEYFRFEGYLRNIIFFEKPAHLVKAHVKILSELNRNEDWLDDWISEYKMYYGDWVFKLLRTLNNAKFLSLLCEDEKCIGFGSIYPSRFQNLIRLNFELNQANWHVPQALLIVAPNLEVLVVKCYDNGERLCWTEPLHDPGYLSHLTSFIFNGCEGLEHEMEFVNSILMKAIVLKTMTIKIKVSDRQLKESVLKKLLMFPRHSTTRILTVE